ncbi:MAG: hypothetical protein ACRDD7_14105 [Peptostreptococcaceae bacterium]
MRYLTDEHFKIAEKNGICRNTLKTRVNDLCWDIQRAITQPVRAKRKSIPKSLQKNKIDWTEYYKNQYFGKIHSINSHIQIELGRKYKLSQNIERFMLIGGEVISDKIKQGAECTIIEINKDYLVLEFDDGKQLKATGDIINIL